MDFKEIIKAHLDKMAEQDSAFKERYELESKSLDACIQYITSQARKQSKGGDQRIVDLVNAQMDTIKAYNDRRSTKKTKIAV